MKPKIEKINWEKVISETTPGVLRDLHHPLIPKLPVLHEADFKLYNNDSPCDTACFDFRDNRRHISIKFLEEMIKHGNIDPRTLVTGIEKHEIGHYKYHPYELARILVLGQFAETIFKDKQANEDYSGTVMAYFSDVVDNFDQMRKSVTGREVRELYRALNYKSEKKGYLSEEEKKQLITAGKDAEEVKRIEKLVRSLSIDRLITGFYQDRIGYDLGVDLTDSPFLEKQLVELRKLTFTLDEIVKETTELVTLASFGNILISVIKELENNLPNLKKQSPAFADMPEVNNFSDEQIEEALDTIIQKHGPHRYRAIRNWLNKKTGKEFDAPRQIQRPSIGIEKTTLKFHDDQIPYYERRARTYGVYIYPKPIVVDSTSSYPEGNKRYNVGDPFTKINRWSTGGLILPGITARSVDAHAKRKEKQYHVPDLLLWFDTSGSMNSHLAEAITSGFVLARNYWENDASVGVVNFSGESAFLQPTRNLDLVYSMLTAYWGGGTVLNIKKVKEYFDKLGRDIKIEGVYTTEDDSLERMTNSLSPEEVKACSDKNIEVEFEKSIAGKLKETYERIDNVMITDGGIANIGQLVSFMNQISPVTRNTIYLIGNDAEAERWMRRQMPQTQIYAIATAKDLVTTVIGANVKRIVVEGSEEVYRK